MSDPMPRSALPDQPKHHPIRSLLVAVVLLVVIFGGLFLWKNYGRAQPQGWHAQPTPVTAMKLTPQELPVSLHAIGNLKAVQQVTLSAEVSGRISEINFKSGATVAADTLLVQLFDGPERAERLSAQAKARLAGHQLARSKKLVPAGAESLDMLQQRQSTHDQTVADIQELDARLRQKQIRAPFAGQLGIRQVNLGEYLNPGQAVVTLTKLETLHVEFTLPQQDFTSIKDGEIVHVSSDAYPDREFTAHVTAIEPQINTDTRNILIQATLPNHDRALRPGMYVTASLALPPQSGAILVPSTAVQTSAQGYSVVIIRGDDADKHGKSEVLSVQLGQRIGNRVVVTQGLKGGDVIVTEGQNRIMPGAELTVAKLVDKEEM
ncbi:efflux RND transporter periplasmic adaptor subunit [Celerinatantimonas sp. YJH-8]|uniref:efflux RND transporter periplasmic adaptor subunit n=1 Tax=Celerinatantimonas sp. YJH-8 TaxID=3228714 RepID=UPI0038C1CC80